ncbi:MAG: TonB-dependent receptor [Gammaproteobacteria bacterium]|nr:TonB-dependent receptor [Gammaproteobacteria bacterium]
MAGRYRSGLSWLTVCGLPLAAAASEPTVPAPANPATVQELPQVTVIGNTPQAGLGLPRGQIPAGVQTGDSESMQRQLSVDLGDYLNDNFSGIHVSETSASPLQPEVTYHGFTASPLLGTPEGLSVYVDGVRVNESFGDTVNWDLLPQSAISTVTLISGSNPVFGLNTLGGALSVRTKSGHDNPGTELEAYGGSFGRRSFEATTGAGHGRFDYFVTARYFDEDGWRDFSPSRLWQAFGKAGWQDERTDIDLSYTYADTRLNGNGPLPTSMLDYRREASYTPPDLTENRLNFLNLTATQFLTPWLLLSGNAYYRELLTSTVNGNINASYLDEDYSGPPLRCDTPPASAAELLWCSPGQNASGRLSQHGAGAGLQLTDAHPLRGAPNQAILGADYNGSDDDFTQSYQYGQLSAERMVIDAQSPFNDQTVVSLAGHSRAFGLYATDTLSPGSLLHLTVSARYNRSTETLAGYSVNSNLGDYGAGFGLARPLSGDHTFSRLNPSMGFTLTPGHAPTFYVQYAEASRAPTVIELGCANPGAPCGLPNEFAGDPSLQQVIARTAELGVRAETPGRSLVWSAGAFRTVNSDDIQFVATAANSGYFDNVGSTRRQGLDLAIGGQHTGFRWQASYSLVDATYRSSFAVNAASNSSADAAGNILVSPGAHIPLIPRHTGRLMLEYRARGWDLGANLVAASGSYLHGNENNANQAGATNAAGALILGSGRLPAYAVTDLHATVRIAAGCELFAKVANLFDRHYATAGFLASNSFTAAGTFIAAPAGWTNEDLVSPAQPRALWAGVRLRRD